MTRIHRLSTAIDGPATEVRLFVAGWNETENGSYLFDAEAAADVMAAYQAHGVDRMFDLEHLSLDPDARNFDPDARGWAQLELRPDGSLWAVNIRWTPDGERRLRDRSQRYVSPAFAADPETKRVRKIVNVAITAMPATHNTSALIAARKVHRMSLSLAEIMLVAKALDLGEEATLDDFLAKIGAMKPAEEAPAADPASEPEPAPEAEAMAAADPAAPPSEEDEEDKDEMAATVAARVQLCKLSGRETVGEAMADVEMWRAAFLNQAAERASVAKSQAKLDADERQAKIVELIKLGAETPATAWADPLAKTLKPCKRLALEPIAELRDRVTKLSAGRKTTPAPGVKPPALVGRSFQVADQMIELSAEELAGCAAVGAKPEVYAANKAYFTRRPR